jgi:hypothetical protein
MMLPYWVRSGQHFVWYRKVRESRHYHDACWVHYLTICGWTLTWETK